MVGLIIKYYGWVDNIFKCLFKDINTSNLKFKINYWESYGDEFENYDEIDSNTFKSKILISGKCFPEFCEIFTSFNGTNDCNIDTYSNFLDSQYFLSISIIDHRNIEICLKDNEVTKLIIKNAHSLFADKLKIVELETISSDARLSIWRQNNKGISN